MFNQSSAFTKYIYSTLMSIIYIITPYCWIAVRSNPNTSKIVTMNSIINKLAKTIFMNIDSTCLTVMNLALHNRWIGSSFDFKTSNAVIVNIIGFKKSLNIKQKLKKNCKLRISKIESCIFKIANYQSIIKCKYAHISSMVYMVATHHWICMVFNPNTS